MHELFEKRIDVGLAKLKEACAKSSEVGDHRARCWRSCEKQ